jgi:hypothetical protein
MNNPPSLGTDPQAADPRPPFGYGAVITPPTTTLIDLLRAAVDKGADVATLERLAKLYEAAELGQKKAEFNNALAAAKAELRPIVKDQEIGLSGGKSIRFESMAAIAAEIDPVLGRHGLYAIFPDAEHTEKHEPNRIYVTCRLCHRNGYSIEKTLDGPPDVGQNRNAVQAMGSTMTYLQRYSLRAILGLAVTNEKEPKQRFTDRAQIGATTPAQQLEPAHDPNKPFEFPHVPGGDWQDWSRSLLMMINAVPALELAKKWVAKNEDMLVELQKALPAHHAFVEREINKRLRKLRDGNETQRRQGSAGAGKR